MTLIFKNFDWSRCTERDSAKHLLHLLMPRSTLHIKDLQTRNSHVRRCSRNVIGRGHLVAVTGVSVELTGFTWLLQGVSGIRPESVTQTS